ncbi:MAG: DNA polymerase III subunit delta' [Pseudomonadales bacterium]
MDVNERYHAIESQLYPWFEAAWQRVYALHSSGRLPHALIINGPRGIGKMHFAGFLASLALCQRGDEKGACGQCRSCNLLGSSGHPDLFHLHPQDEAGQIKVDQVRELEKFMHSTAQQGGYRVVLLEPAESMNIAASNALLKTLEEPGQKCLMLLISHQIGQVLPTIKSRCQRIDCPVPDGAKARDWLSAELSMESAAAEQLLKIVHGAPLQGLVFSSGGAQELRAELFTGLKLILQRKKTGLELAAQLAKQDLVILLSWLYSLLVDVSKAQQCEDPSLANGDMRNMIKTLAGRCSVAKLYALSDAIQHHRTALVQHQNPNKQLLLEELFLGWQNLIGND